MAHPGSDAKAEVDVTCKRPMAPRIFVARCRKISPKRQAAVDEPRFHSLQGAHVPPNQRIHSCRSGCLCPLCRRVSPILQRHVLPSSQLLYPAGRKARGAADSSPGERDHALASHAAKSPAAATASHGPIAGAGCRGPGGPRPLILVEGFIVYSRLRGVPASTPLFRIRMARSAEAPPAFFAV